MSISEVSSNDEFCYYAKPGTNECIRCKMFTQPTGYIKVPGPCPLDGAGTYICDEAGDWIIPSENYESNYNENVRVTRAKEYLEVATITDQLEALMEDKLGNPTKLNVILEKFKSIRDANPKL